MLKLLLGNPYVFGGIALVIIALGVWGGVEHSLRIAAEKGEAAAELSLTVMTKDRNAQAKAVRVGQGIIEGMQKQWDEADTKASAVIKAQQRSAQDLAAALQTTSDEREAYLQQLMEAGHARPVIVSQGVKDGWNPIVLAGMRKLKCVQLAALTGNLPAADCGVQAQDGSRGPVAAGDSAGAGDYRPTFDQQLQFLSDAWRLRDWGSSCYSDKRAIAASQAQP